MGRQARTVTRVTDHEHSVRRYGCLAGGGTQLKISLNDSGLSVIFACIAGVQVCFFRPPKPYAPTPRLFLPPSGAPSPRLRNCASWQRLTPA